MFNRTRTIWQRLTGGGRSTSELQTERRYWVRYPSDRQTLIRLDVVAAEPVLVKVQDVSRGGIGLMAHRALEVGTVIRIDLPSPTGEPPNSVKAEVVHERPVEGGGWSVGCRFATQLSDEALEGLGARMERPVGVERRTAERQTSRGHVLYRPVNLEQPERSAPIHSISLNGIGMVLNEDADPGSLLSLELHDESGTAVLTILACVVYVTNAGGGKWMAGCNFVRELDDAELAAVVK